MRKEAVRRTRKRIEEVVQYALGHRIRIQVLMALNEGTYTAAELSRIIGVPQKTLQNHLRRMVEDGSIEIDREEEVGNRVQYRYRSVVRTEYSAEEFERLHPTERQTIVGAILHSGIAEVLAGFHAKKLAEPGAHVFWNWYNLDEKGRADADALTHRYLRDLRRIKDKSTARAEVSGEKTTSTLLELFLFERPRKGADSPHRIVADRVPRTAPAAVSGRLRVARRFFGWGNHHPPSA